MNNTVFGSKFKCFSGRWMYVVIKSKLFFAKMCLIFLIFTFLIIDRTINDKTFKCFMDKFQIGISTIFNKIVFGNRLCYVLIRVFLKGDELLKIMCFKIRRLNL